MSLIAGDVSHGDGQTKDRNVDAWPIDSRRLITLGGLPQTIHIWGTNPAHPVILMLHGGPGFPDRGSIGAHDLDLTDAFTVVAWDQRGTGGSYRGCDFSTLTLDQIVADACALVEYLCTALHQSRLFILGSSWGTEIGTLLVARHPEHIAAYVGMGQVVDGHDNERLSWEFCLKHAREAGDARNVRRLLSVGPPQAGQYRHGIRGLLTERRILAQYGGHANRKERYVSSMIQSVLHSSEYTPADRWGIARGSLRSLKALWPTAVHYNFRTLGPMQVPYFILQGRHDYNTPASLVDEYIHTLSAPIKELVWFEHSAHSPLSQEPERCKQWLRDRLLAIDVSQ